MVTNMFTLLAALPLPVSFVMGQTRGGGNPTEGDSVVTSATAVGATKGRFNTDTTMNPIEYKIANPAPGYPDRAFPFRGESFTIDSPVLEMKYSQVYWKTLPPIDLPPEIVKRFADSGTMGVTGFEVDVLRRDETTGEIESVPAYQSYNHHYSPSIISGAVKLKLDSEGLPTGPDMGHGKILEFELCDDTDDDECDDAGSSPPPPDARLVQSFVHGNGQEHRQLFHGMPRGYSQPIYRPSKFVLTPMQISTNDGTGKKRGHGATLLPKYSREHFPPDVPYSPLLECPCTTRITKELGRSYTSAREACSEPLPEGDCFVAATEAVRDARGEVVSNTTLTDPSAPRGCLVSRTAVGASTYKVEYNKYDDGSETPVSCDARSATADPSQRRLTGFRQDLVGIGLDVDGASDTVEITLTGPADVWFGVGFDATRMADAPYAIIVDGGGNVEERKLGDHAAGNALASSVRVVSNVVDPAGKMRTVILQRSLKGASSDHYTFDPTEATIPVINAIGDTPDLRQHIQRSATALSMFNADTTETCLCAQEGGGTIDGIPYDADCKSEPLSDLRSHDNPTCRVSTYAGGLACCPHGTFLLDADQTPPPFVDRIFFRFRFYFEEYDPARGHRELNHVEWSQNGCDSGCTGKNEHSCRHIEFDVTQGTGSIPAEGTPAGTDVQVFRSNFKAGYMLAESCTPRNGACMDARKVGPNGKFKLILAATHCHAPNCLRQDLLNAETGDVLCSAIPIHGTSDEVYSEEGYLYAPPCVWGTQEEGLQSPPVLHMDTPLEMVTYFDSTLGHTGQMGIWQMKGAYIDPLPPLPLPVEEEEEEEETTNTRPEATALD